MRFEQIARAIAFPIFLAGCASPGADAGAHSNSRAAVSSDGTVESNDSAGDGAAVEMRVFFAKSCPVSGATQEGVFGGLALAVASNVVGKLVGSGVDALGQYLSNQQAITFMDATRVDGFITSTKGIATYNQNISCMIVVAARSFGGPQPQNYDPLPTLAQTVLLKNSIYKATKLSGTALFYMEAALHFNNPDSAKLNSTAFTYIPKSFYYPAFITPGGWRYSASRDVLLKIDFSAPSQTATFASFEWQWSGVKSGAISENSVLAKTLPWSALPDGLAAAASKINSDTATPVFPVNIKVLLTETAKPHVILKYLGEALVAQKTAIVDSATSTVNQAFSEQARVAVRQAAANDVGKKYDDYISAYDAAKLAQEKYLAAGDLAARKKSLALAQLAYVKLTSAESAVRLAYDASDIGSFDALPKLPDLPKTT
jgi:hypothetical protein